jgi:hypothetical protein
VTRALERRRATRIRASIGLLQSGATDVGNRPPVFQRRSPATAHPSGASAVHAAFNLLAVVYREAFVAPRYGVLSVIRAVGLRQF